VVEASDGVRCLKLAQQRSPDVILLDLALPGRSGLEVLTVLKEQQPTREIPIIIVSAYALLLLRDGLRRADGMIQKPFDLADLLAKVREAVDRTRVPA
jgi:CheY-like chemotaxis protein